jgi:hypothetical protein
MDGIHQSAASPMTTNSGRRTLISNEIPWDKVVGGGIETLLGLAGLGYWIGQEITKTVIAPAFNAALRRAKNKAGFAQRLATEMGKREFRDAISKAGTTMRGAQVAKLITAAIEAAAEPPRTHTGHAPVRALQWTHTGNTERDAGLRTVTPGHRTNIKLDLSNTGNAQPDVVFPAIFPPTTNQDLSIRVYKSDVGTLYTAKSSSRKILIGVVSGNDPIVADNIKTLNRLYPGSVHGDFYEKLSVDRGLFILAHGDGSKYFVGSTKPEDQHTWYSAGLITQILMQYGAEHLPYVFGLCCHGAAFGPKFAKGGITYAGADRSIGIDKFGRVFPADKRTKVYVFFPDGSKVDAKVTFPATLESIDIRVRATILAKEKQ